MSGARSLSTRLLSFIACLPSQAGAEKSAPLQPDDIIVTAEKTQVSINKVGMSVQAFRADTLRDAGVNDVSDLVRLVPGFNYTLSSYGHPVYTMRGIGFYDTGLGAAPGVVVYIDEAPLPYSATTLGAALDVERVEVLKGPQGTLFGQNTTGGAINYIAAKPTDALGAGGQLTVGRFGEVDGEAYLTGALSGELRGRVAVRHERSDDWQRSYTRSDGLDRAISALAASCLIGRRPIGSRSSSTSMAGATALTTRRGSSRRSSIRHRVCRPHSLPIP